MFCKAPFASQAQWAYGGVSMCCNDTRVEHTTLEAEWNNKDRMETRKAFMNGEVPDRCKRCVGIIDNEESDGLISHYDHQISRSKEDLIGMCDANGRILSNPSYLHLSPSSKCQLACRMCSPEVSSAYAKTFEKEPRSGVAPEDIVAYVAKCAPELEYYVAHGGEPLMSPYFNDIMDELLKYRNNISLCVLGNGMSLYSKGRDIMETLKAFKASEFMFSIDGTKEVNDYQRVHANLDTIMKNLHRVHEESPETSIKVNHTLSNLTVQNLPEFYEFITREAPFLENLNHGYVHYPLEYQMHNLRDKDRETLLERLESFDTKTLPETFRRSFEGVKERVAWVFKDKAFEMELWNKFFIKEHNMNLMLKNNNNLIDLIKL